MMTEDEARKKWCPYAISALVEAKEANVMANRVMAFDRNTKALGSSQATMCIASDCMMWRWGVEWYSKATGEKIKPGQAVASSDIDERYGVGFCGLAGKP